MPQREPVRNQEVLQYSPEPHHQLPLAPPPPELPPPPLKPPPESLLKPPLLKPPPELPPLQPLLLRPSLKRVRKNPINAAIRPMPSEPSSAHPTTPATPPTRPAPRTRPNTARRMPPPITTKTNSPNSHSGEKCFAAAGACARGGGSFSPSMTRMMRSAPARMPL